MVTFSKRNSLRHYDQAPILLQTKYDYSCYNKDNFYYTCAKMHNYSCEGMYFESDYALQPGAKVNVEMADDTMPCIADRELDVYCAEVKWCKKIATSDVAHFGVGIRFFKPFYR